MKVAVFQSKDEVIVLAVKGKTNSVKDIDGFDEWFGEETGRNVEQFDACLCHIGAGEGIYVTTNIKTDWLSDSVDIEHWFYND